MGINVVAAVGRMKMDGVTKSVLLFMTAQFIVMLRMALFPSIATVPARRFTGCAPSVFSGSPRPPSQLEHLRSIEARIADADQKIKAFMRSSALCKKISAIDGVGAVTATAIVAGMQGCRDAGMQATA
jgi:hypothetical protein